MIKAANIVSDFLDRLRADDFFDGIKLTRALPDLIKASPAVRETVAAGIKEINVEEYALGQNETAGTAVVFADIYVPFSSEKARLEEIVMHICGCTAELNIISLEISGITVSNAAECYMMRAVFTFSGSIEF